MSIIALGAGADPQQFTLHVTPQLSVGHPDNLFLFGGAGMAAGLSAIETATGRPTVWAAAQYLSYARPGQTADARCAGAGQRQIHQPGAGGGARWRQ